MVYFWVALTLVSWGIGGLFDKKAVERGNGWVTFLTCQLFNIPLLAILLAILPAVSGPVQITSGVAFWEALNALGTLVASVAYFHAMTRSGASWVLGITAGYPIVGQLVSCVALGEPFSWAALASAAVVSVGVAAIAHSGKRENSMLTRKDKIILAVCVATALIIWGILGIFDRLVLNHAKSMEDFFVTTIWRAVFCVAAIPLLRKRLVPEQLANPSMWFYTWLSAICLAAGNIGFIQALPAVPTGYLIIVTACYPMVMYLGALVFLKEKPNYLRLAGILLIVGGLGLAELTNNRTAAVMHH